MIVRGKGTRGDVDVARLGLGLLVMVWRVRWEGDDAVGARGATRPRNWVNVVGFRREDAIVFFFFFMSWGVLLGDGIG